MPYCRKCGSKLDDDARFCRVCGTPVEVAISPQAVHSRKSRRGPLIIPVIVLVSVLIVALFVAALFLVPFRPVNFYETFEVSSVAGVDTIDLNFQADVADVTIIPTSLTGQNVRMDVSAAGSVGILGSSDHPVKITFDNESIGNVLRVNSVVSRHEAWPASFNLKVVCNIYIDNSKSVTIHSETSVGQVTINPEKTVTFQDLSLHSTTGGVRTNLNNTVVLNGDISISTTTGTIHFALDNAEFTRDITINLATTTGSVNANVNQNKAFEGNVSIEATTTTGSVNFGMDIDGDVGAMMTSQTSLGSISVDVQSFNGNKSPIYSSNYPAAGNFLVDSKTTTGGVDITATYRGSEGNSEQEQIRDTVMTYIRANHLEAAQFMNYQDKWSGGRVNTGIIGAVTYSYTNSGWNVTMKYPVVPNPIYTISADYSGSSSEPTIPYRVIWEGTWHSGVVNETNYVFAQ